MTFTFKQKMYSNIFLIFLLSTSYSSAINITNFFDYSQFERIHAAQLVISQSPQIIDTMKQLTTASNVDKNSISFDENLENYQRALKIASTTTVCDQLAAVYDTQNMPGYEKRWSEGCDHDSNFDAKERFCYDPHSDCVSAHKHFCSWRQALMSGLVESSFIELENFTNFIEKILFVSAPEMEESSAPVPVAMDGPMEDDAPRSGVRVLRELSHFFDPVESIEEISPLISALLGPDLLSQADSILLSQVLEVKGDLRDLIEDPSLDSITRSEGNSIYKYLEPVFDQIDRKLTIDLDMRLKQSENRKRKKEEESSNSSSSSKKIKTDV